MGIWGCPHDGVLLNDAEGQRGDQSLCYNASANTVPTLLTGASQGDLVLNLIEADNGQAGVEESRDGCAKKLPSKVCLRTRNCRSYQDLRPPRGALEQRARNLLSQPSTVLFIHRCPCNQFLR
jgi:hypothetical protein